MIGAVNIKVIAGARIAVILAGNIKATASVLFVKIGEVNTKLIVNVPSVASLDKENTNNAKNYYF